MIIKEAENIWRCSKCFTAKRTSLRLENLVNTGNIDLFEIKEIILHFKEDTDDYFNTLNAKFNVIHKIITENNVLKTHIIQLEN